MKKAKSLSLATVVLIFLLVALGCKKDGDTCYTCKQKKDNVVTYEEDNVCGDISKADWLSTYGSVNNPGYTASCQ